MPLRARIVHDNSVRRIDPITPDILRAPTQDDFARSIFPAARESKRQYRQGDSMGKSPDRERESDWGKKPIARIVARQQ
jgi:hypothetical protein